MFENLLARAGIDAKVPSVRKQYHFRPGEWFDDGEASPTCRAVIEHMKRVESADLAFPIVLSADGIHRVAKSYGQSLSAASKLCTVLNFSRIFPRSAPSARSLWSMRSHSA